VTPDVLTAMLEGCCDFAKLMLSKAGDFYPFGETADPSGKISVQGGWNGEEHPDRRAIYELLQEAFARDVREGKLAALALAGNVTIPTEYRPELPDGIRVHIEARGYSRFFYLPYRVERRTIAQRLLRRPYRVAYGALFSVDVPPAFFPGSGPTTR